MHTDVECVRTGMSVGQLAEFLRDRGIRGTPVLNTEGRLVGVVSVFDIVFSGNTFGENDILLDYLSVFNRVWENNFKKPLQYLLSISAEILSITDSYSLALFQYTVLNNLMPLEHSSNLQLNRPVELQI